MPLAGEVHGHARGVRRRDRLLVAHRAARLHDRAHARIEQDLRTVGEREERVGGGHAARGTLTGALDPSDQRFDSGKYLEVHTFDGDAGEPVRVEMSSTAFDTFLIVETPSGERLTNDDFEGDQSRSVANRLSSIC